MKRNTKHIIFAAALCLLLAVVTAFSVSAADPLTIAVKYQMGSLSAGESFTATVYVKNPEAVTRDKLVGLSYSFIYDNALFEANNSTIAVAPSLTAVNGWNQSAVSYQVGSGSVRFASHVLLFDNETGYAETLNELFSVTFTAKTTVADIEAAFAVQPVIKAVSTTGQDIAVQSDSMVFTNFYLDDLIKDTVEDVAFSENPTAGTASIEGTALYLQSGKQTASDLQGRFASEEGIEVRILKDGVKMGSSAPIVNGCVVELYELGVLKQTSVVIVRGDADGNGEADVYDAVEMLKYIVGDTAPDEVTRLAMKLLPDTMDIRVYDVVELLEYIANGSRW
ncbi:MAG: hypothetical protein IKL84_03465 [Clostridia bacterium]|nr:hypothetical protein [Clostridia bacterium]